MLDVPADAHKPHRVETRPPFERIALLLQGGGALGSYQAGVYQALAEANLHPDWVAGISIGAVNAALIAGNPPEKRVEKLREFWESVSATPPDPFGFQYDPSDPDRGHFRPSPRQSGARILHYAFWRASFLYSPAATASPVSPGQYRNP